MILIQWNLIQFIIELYFLSITFNNHSTLVSLFIADILSVRKFRCCSGLPVKKFCEVFRILIKVKYAYCKEIFNKQCKNYFLNRFVPRNLLLHLFAWTEKPKWKWMAEDIYMQKLFRYFNGFLRTKFYFLTQFVPTICFLFSLKK